MHLPLELAAREASPADLSSTSMSRLFQRRDGDNGDARSQSQPRNTVYVRATGQSPQSSINSQPIVIALGVVGGIAFLVIVYYVLARTRDRHKDAKYLPTQFLKKRWSAWRSNKPSSSYRTTTDHLEPISEPSTAGTNRTSRVRPPPPAVSAANATTAGAAQRSGEARSGGVDRNTSVRSVMTLPAYMAAPGESEQVLGREGERAGIDVVLEYPETVDEIEEQRREEEMEALYQVRLQRRTEAAEREEIRRLRREARERNDWVALEELRTRTRAASGARASNTLEELRGEHARLRDRQRAVSSVSYADLGVATHDGTRIRANSEESERPLLGDAASMASSRFHRRDRSASSVLSIDSDLPSPSLTRSRADSRAESNLRRGSIAPSGAMSSPEIIDAENDIGDEDFPTHSPPEYEDIALQDTPRHDAPPDYSSPTETHAPGLGLSMTNASSEQEGSSSSGNGTGTQEQLPGRGVGGTPQLPGLRLNALPSIVVNTPTPVTNPAEEHNH